MKMLIASLMFFTQDPKEEMLKQHEAIEKMVTRLDEKIVQLIEKLSARGEKERVDRLKGAHEKLRSDALADRVRMIKLEVERSNLARAQEETDQALETLRQIVRILEQAADETPADIEWLETILGKVQKLIPRQKDIRDAAQKDADAQDGVEKETRGIEKALGQRGFEGLRKFGNDAAKAMQKSSDSIRKGDPKGAHQNSQDGLDGLGKLADGIQGTIDELKRKLHDQDRVRMAEELQRILASEKIIRKETSSLDESKGKEGYLDRKQISKARRLAQDQGDLRNKMEEIRKAVAQENVDVFEFVIEMVMEEMSDIAGRLAESDVSRPIQELEDSVIRRLEDLIEAWNTPEGKPRNGGTPGSDVPAEPPLVPDVVQLNLMKKLQEAILQKTVRARTDPMAEDLQQRVVNRLSEEQRKLTDLMGEYIKRLGAPKHRMDRGQGISFEPDQDEPEPTLEGIRKLMERSESELYNAFVERSEGTQKDIIEQLRQLIRDSNRKAPPSSETKQAREPYSPRRVDPPPFVVREPRRGEGWHAALPPRERARIIEEMSRRDLYLPEFQDQIRDFMLQLMEPGR